MNKQDKLNKAAEQAVIKEFPSYEPEDCPLRKEKIEKFSRLFVAGAKWMKEQMIDNSESAWIEVHGVDEFVFIHPHSNERMLDIVKNQHITVFDDVKFIIVKEEEI